MDFTKIFQRGDGEACVGEYIYSGLAIQGEIRHPSHHSGIVAFMMSQS